MKSIAKVFLALVCVGGFELLATEAQVDGILSSQEDGEAIEELTEAEINFIRGLQPVEAVSQLISEAVERSGSKYAKSLVVSAALIEMLHVPKNEHRVLSAVTEWIDNSQQGELEDKLLTAFSPFLLDLDEKVAILQSLIDDLEESEGSSMLEIYGAALAFGFPDVTATEVLTLKKIEVLVASGDFESADQLLADAENRQWSEECSEYLASIRLLKELQENDTPLLRRE